MNGLEKRVAEDAAPWAESRYFAEAEKWTYIFWNEGTPFRRLFDKLDLSSVVELSCGHGRHAERCAGAVKRLTLIDIFPQHVAVARRRLQSYKHLTYIVGNGYDFRPLKDASTTAIYCYDAMVHFDPDVVAAYLKDAARILAPGGRALFHHSNYDAPRDRRYGSNPHARNRMTFEVFSRLAADAGLTIIESVVMNWGNEKDLDRLTLLEKLA